MSCHIMPLIINSLRGRHTHTGIYTKVILRNQVVERVAGIQGKREQEWEWKTRTGTCKNICYSSDSLPVKSTELCKPSHKYSIVFLSYNMHWYAQNSISTDAIHNLL